MILTRGDDNLASANSAWWSYFPGEDRMELESARLVLGNSLPIGTPQENAMMRRTSDGFIEEMNINHVGYKVYTPNSTPANGGTYSVDFTSDAKAIVEVNCTNITTSFTLNFSNTFNSSTVMGSAGWSAVYTLRFYDVSGSGGTVTLDSGKTFYDETGATVSSITLTASEDRMVTMYTKDGTTFYSKDL